MRIQRQSKFSLLKRKKKEEIQKAVKKEQHKPLGSYYQISSEKVDQKINSKVHINNHLKKVKSQIKVRNPRSKKESKLLNIKLIRNLRENPFRMKLL